MKSRNLRKKNVLEDISSKSEGSSSNDSDKVEHALGENAPIPDGELSEDLPKSREKFEISKKQKDSSSRNSKYTTNRKKLKLSEDDEAAESESSNFTSVDELDEPSEVGTKGGTSDQNNISEPLLLRPTNSEEKRNVSTIADQCLIHSLSQIQPHGTEMQRTEAACDEDDLNKTRKRDKLPIRGGKKLCWMNTKEPIESSGLASLNQTTKGKEKMTSMNTKEPIENSGLASLNQTTKGKEKMTSMNTKEPIESSGLASLNQTTKGKEKMTSMNIAPTGSGSAAPNQTTKGKENALINATLRSSGPALNNLFDFETIIRNKLAAVNNASASWKGAGASIQCSSPMPKDTSNSSSKEKGLALGSTPYSGNIGAKTSSTYSSFLNFKDIDDDWSEMELEALLSFVKKYGLGNWNVKFQDPDLQVIRNKTGRELAEKWEMVGSKMLPYLPNSYMPPVTADRSTLHASQGNGIHSAYKTPALQFPSAQSPIHRPSPRFGIPPFNVQKGNQALNWGRIKPSSNGIFGPQFQGSSAEAFNSLHPLASALPRELSANLNSMNAQLMAQLQNERANQLAQNFRPTSVQRPQTPPLSLSETTISSPANVGTEARSQFRLGGTVRLPNNWRLNENGGHEPDNRK
ncbi:hypothetical protein VNO80_26681 [Phaseolus coccineus]|uniref:Myb-like domain-containing protein n=1 Tax=Phaseolus coccineus TaxID=3886 RepID=A0AAN9LF85_PHACN